MIREQMFPDFFGGIQNGFFLQWLLQRPYVPGLCSAAVLQSLLQADERLGRRHVDCEPQLHLYLHLHAAERHGRRYVDIDGQQQQQRLQLRLLRLGRRHVDGLRVLPPVRLRLVRQRRRYFQLELEHQFQLQLRMQPLLWLSRHAAGRSTIRWGVPSVYQKSQITIVMYLLCSSLYPLKLYIFGKRKQRTSTHCSYEKVKF